MKPRLYDRNMNFVCVLQNATAVSYTKKYNDLYTASFELPIDDPKVAECKTQYIVDIFDGQRSVGKYRILDEPEVQLTASSPFAKFSCEHVIAFLLNDVIDGYLETGGEGKNTQTVINQLLNKQTTKRWKLGTCTPNAQFQYSWQNTNLCDALFSVTSCFDTDYHWTYNTDSYPWTVNLVAMSTTPQCMIIKGKNMQQIKRTKDASQLCTRLYCKGYGQGVNQLTIKDVNNGVPYIESDTVSKYGVMSSHFIDTTITDAATLLAKGRRVLNLYKEPRYTYTAKAIDLYRVTGKTIDFFTEGVYVRIYDHERGVDVDAKIVEVTKNDVDGDPLDVDITISNKDSDTADTIEDLARRTAITAQYSQGATNLYSQQFADNADADNGAVMKFYVPSSCVRINQVLLNWSRSQFRAYSKSASSSSQSTQTSSSSGGQSVTSQSGGGCTKTDQPAARVTSTCGTPTAATGPSQIRETTQAGAHTHTWSYTLSWGHMHTTLTTFAAGSNTGGVYNYKAKSLSGTTSENGNHTHKFNHSHQIVSAIDLDKITITIPNHTHTVTTSNHTHTVTVPSHSHGITYGIYKGDTASKCSLKIDGTVAIEEASDGTDIDIVPYLSKDSNGKINRGTWHTIQIVPDKMTRIEANLFVQTFVTSYEGGNY